MGKSLKEAIRMKQTMKKIMAIGFSIMMCAGVFQEKVQATILEDPIVFLCGMDKYISANGTVTTSNDTEYFPEVESYYKYDKDGAIVVQQDYFESFSDLKNMLSVGNYVWVSTHGGEGAIATFDADGYYNGGIYYTDFMNYSSSKFANVELCVLLACESAKGSVNVCSAIQARGAKCVIGFQECIDAKKAKEWQLYFAEAQAIGWTVASAIRYADSQVYDETQKSWGDLFTYGNLNKHVVYGNSNLRYN